MSARLPPWRRAVERLFGVKSGPVEPGTVITPEEAKALGFVLGRLSVHWREGEVRMGMITTIEGLGKCRVARVLNRCQVLLERLEESDAVVPFQELAARRRAWRHARRRH